MRKYLSDNSLYASFWCIVWSFICTALLSFSLVQNVSAVTTSLPEVMITSGYASSEDRVLQVEFAIGDVFVGDGVYSESNSAIKNVGLGFFVGEPLPPRIIYYKVKGELVYSDTINPGCEIIPFEAPEIKDSVFVGWYPLLPEIMPEADPNKKDEGITVNAIYRPLKWELKPNKKSFCPGEFAEFTVKTDDMKGLEEYKVVYVKNQLDGNFVQSDYQQLDVYEDSAIFEVPIPADYIGANEVEEFRVRFKYADGRESDEILVKCNVDLPSSLIISKYGEVVLLDSKRINAVDAAWYKNGVKVSHTGLQYVEESKLYGEYSAIVRTKDEVERRVCAKSIYYEVGLEQGIIVNPNPAKHGEEIKISVKGFSKNQIEGSTLDVFDVLGSQRMMEVTSVDEDVFLTLSEGVYIVTLRLATGKVYSLKFIVY